MSTQNVSERPDFDHYFLNLADQLSLRSHDVETKVGALIVDEQNRILSTGYNGFPAGVAHDIWPHSRPHKYPYMIHAEVNAICALPHRVSHHAKIYISLSPCHECAKMIVASGIKNIIYKQQYQSHDPNLTFPFEQTVEFLKTCGVSLKQIV